MNKNSFRWRAFVSFFLVLTFLMSTLSGIVLFLRPEGSLAAWTGWAALGLDKKGWEGLHVVAIFFFLLFALIHLAGNWRVLLAYCRRRRDPAAGTGRFRELLAALLLFSLLLAGTLGKWQPLRWIVDLRAWFKGGAAVVAAAPPAADAEKLPLAALCPLLGFRGEELLENARRQGIRVLGPSQTLGAVARMNRLSPERVYMLLRERR